MKHTWPPGGPETPACPLAPYVKKNTWDLAHPFPTPQGVVAPVVEALSQLEKRFKREKGEQYILTVY